MYSLCLLLRLIVRSWKSRMKPQYIISTVLDHLRASFEILNNIQDPDLTGLQFNEGQNSESKQVFVILGMLQVPFANSNTS